MTTPRPNTVSPLAAEHETAPVRGLPTINPSVKLVVLTAISLALLLVLDPVTPALVYGGLLVLWWFDSTVALRTLVLGQLPFVGFAVSVLLVNVLARSEGGWTVGGSLAIRTMVVGLGVILMIRTTEPARLLESLRQNLRLPDKVCFAVLAGYRLLSDLPTHWQTLLRAHRVRGMRRLTLAVFGRSALALLATSIRRGERMSITMQTRGLGGGPRTTWRPQRVTVRDVLWALVVLGTFAGIVAVGAHLGYLRGPSALG